MYKKLLLTLLMCMTFSGLFAQKTISELTKDATKKDGYFTYYWDEKGGKVWLEIQNLEQEFLYVNSLAAGIGSNDIGLDRGQLGGTKVVEFRRVGPKVFMVQPNYSYRASSTNADEVRAVDEAFAESVIFSFKVEAEENGKILVDMTAFLTRDSHGVVGRLRREGSYRLDANRSAIYPPNLKNFPKNSEFEATLTFAGTPNGRNIRSVTPDAEAVTVRTHHSFIELPDNNYTPRLHDPRAGYGAISYMDYATPIESSITKRYIRRHRLEKKNPRAKTSEAVEPIIYYVDRGAPEPIKSALIEGAQWWNQAYEAAGFKNAFQVKEMPEGADNLDVRYNVIQWVHRSTRGWSYGSSITDPRTGEIIKGHVSLGSLRVRQDFLIAQGLLTPYENGTTPDPKLLELAISRLRQLSAHEVGHTIGLNHNYASSFNNRASVMDYPHPQINLTNGAIDLSDAYDVGIGDWDKAAINFGYRVFDSKTNEADELNKIMEKQFADGLFNISDQDARAPGGAHPFSHLWDNGKSPADELDRLMDVRKVVMANFSEKNIPMGAPMATLEEALVPMYMIHRYQFEAATKVLAGSYYSYKLRGDSQPAHNIVPVEEQKAALASLINVIQPENLAFPQHILDMIPPRPPGYGRSRETFKVRTGPMFDPIAPGESIAGATISFMLNPQRATRLVQQKAMDANQLGLIEVVDALQAAVMEGDHTGYNKELQRMVADQYINGLMKLAQSGQASAQARNVGLFGLQSFIMASQPNMQTTDKSEQAYLLGMSVRIQNFMNNMEEAKPTNALTPPDGSPIGSDLQIWCDFSWN
jgi:hypothetical protein